MLWGKRQGREHAAGGGPQPLCRLDVGALETQGSSGQEAPAQQAGATPAGKLPAPRRPSACLSHGFFFFFFCMGEVSSGGWPEKILHRKVRVWENTAPGFAGKPGTAGL